MPQEKTIHDPVHGSMALGGIVLDLIDTAEVQRLRGIKQLGLANVAFPGANHSRFEHALGVAYVAGKVAEELDLDEHERNLLQAAAVLHDIGHAPYSHTLEHLMVSVTQMDHMELTGRIIQGELDIEECRPLKIRAPRVSRVLEKWGVAAEEVSQLLTGKHKRRYLGELLHSEVDVDQIDYLLRDSHYTGVALGMVDADRLIKTLTVAGGRLCILEKGVEAVEGMLTARGLMYSSVYYHHTVRSAEVMLSNAVSWALEHDHQDQLKHIFLMNDSQLVEALWRIGGYAAEMVSRIEYRRLFKTAYVEPRRELSSVEKRRYLRRFGRADKVREIQDEIAERAGVRKGLVLLDVPVVDIITSEPRIQKVEMPVVSEKGLKQLTEVSPIAEALKRRQAPRYLVRVLTDQKFVPKVKRAAERVLE
jgi:hypothetical protein